MHLSITQEWVNFHKGGIVVGNQTWGVQLVEIEDYSDKAYANYGATVLMDPTEGFAVDFMFGPYSSGAVVFSIYCFLQFTTNSDKTFHSKFSNCKRY
jgi:hypothetical protein